MTRDEPSGRGVAMSGPVERALDELIARHDGRAAGLWRRDGDALRQVAFRPAPDLPDGVRDGFAAATLRVPLSATDLSIVQAAVAGRPVLAIASALPPDAGSGRWLRAFGAACSLAVPLGPSRGVLSVALRSVPADPDGLAGAIRAIGDGLPTDDSGSDVAI
jgi:hypothetical protein